MKDAINWLAVIVAGVALLIAQSAPYSRC